MSGSCGSAHGWGGNEGRRKKEEGRKNKAEGPHDPRAGLRYPIVSSFFPVCELAESRSAVRTIILTDRVDTPDVLCAVQRGARGVVPKDSAPEVLFKSIASVMAGHFWLGPEQFAEGVPGLRR